MNNKKINVLLVEDQQLFRNGVRALLEDTDDIAVPQDCENGSELMQYLNNAPELPDVILLDMNLPDTNGYELTTMVLKKYPLVRILVLTVYEQDRFISKMIDAGAAGYLLKTCEVAELTNAIRTVHTKGFYFNEHMVKAMRQSNKRNNNGALSFLNIPVELTTRETEILQLICKEYTNADIAEMLHISSRTVDGHRNNLLAKTGTKNTAGLVVFALTNQLYDPSLR